MPIIAKGNGGNFTPAPEGMWPGVCVDVVDKGMVESAKYKPRHMIQIRWVIEAEPALPSGKPHMAVRSFGLSLNEKSSLRPFLETWRGKKFTEDELEGFDIEKLIGACGQVQILHNKVSGNTYANVQMVAPYSKKLPPVLIPEDYIRECDRPQTAPVERNTEGEWEPQPVGEVYQATDEDMPF